MTIKLKTLLATAAIGLALTACKAAENTVQKTGDTVAQKAASITLPAGITKVESVGPAKGDQVVIPYTKYKLDNGLTCLLYTSPSPRDATLSRMPSSA